MWHEHHTNNDEIAIGLCPEGVRGRTRHAVGILFEVVPEGLHLTPTVRIAGVEDVPEDRLSRGRGTAPRLVRPPRGTGAPKGAPLHHHPKGRHTPKKRPTRPLECDSSCLHPPPRRRSRFRSPCQRLLGRPSIRPGAGQTHVRSAVVLRFFVRASGTPEAVAQTDRRRRYDAPTCSYQLP